MAKTIVFSDCDGTLLNSKHELTVQTYRAIKHLQAVGIPFVIISGRSPLGLYPLLERYQFNCPLICYSGALILNEEGEVWQNVGFSAAMAQKIVNFIEINDLDLTWNAYTAAEWYVRKFDERVKNEMNIVRATPKVINGNLAEILPSTLPVNKIMCICAPGKITAIAAAIKAAFPQLSVTMSSSRLLEIMHKGVNKGRAMQLFCRYLHVPLKNTIAFGDSYNDVEMLQTAGKYYLMANAEPELLAKFPKHTLSNDADGICAALKRLNLIN